MGKCIIILRLIGIMVLSPIIGGLLAGIDRKISARMQGRSGPPILQPFYDVLKLMKKEGIEVNRFHRFYVYIALFFSAFATEIVLMGGDILLAMFALTLGAIFFVLGGYAGNSSYSFFGTERELLQMMAYEPMVLITGAGFYYASGSFFLKNMIEVTRPAILYLPGIFIGMVFVLVFKLRKSPFDLSLSHHGGHQEIVSGISTEYSGKELAIIEITHWYESVFAYTLIALFFLTKNPWSYLFAALASIIVYFFEILIDNCFARVKWQMALKTGWIITAVLATVNFTILSFFR